MYILKSVQNVLNISQSTEKEGRDCFYTLYLQKVQDIHICEQDS